MPNSLAQDPLAIDTTGTDFRCQRIVAFKYDGAGTVTVVDGSTAAPLWGHSGSRTFDPIELFVASGLIDVTISAGTLYIYLGSGPR